MKTAEQQLEYYQQHPPSFLGGFSVRPTLLAHFGFDGHGGGGVFPYIQEDPNIVFQISCQCGGKQFFLLAKANQHEIHYYESMLMADHYSLSCLNCGKETAMFDIAQHGYDSESARTSKYANASSHQTEVIIKGPKTAMYACANCEAHVVNVVIRLEYPGDLFGDSVFAGREHEFFSWISIMAICPECSAVNIAADFECA